ncbi:hypothetical protein [Streptomyces sp. NPDC101393]|uniref:hypothetical protein n=1 Tax=Streptomyces sp. NPDC101393 TaxID=3366141 RepID=UPI00382662BA
MRPLGLKWTEADLADEALASAERILHKIPDHKLASEPQKLEYQVKELKTSAPVIGEGDQRERGSSRSLFPLRSKKLSR